MRMTQQINGRRLLVETSQRVNVTGVGCSGFSEVALTRNPQRWVYLSGVPWVRVEAGFVGKITTDDGPPVTFDGTEGE